MLHAGLIRHTVNKTTFSDQCYYTLGDIVTNTSSGELVYVIIINIIMLLLLQMLHCSVTCWPDTTRCWVLSMLTDITSCCRLAVWLLFIGPLVWNSLPANIHSASVSLQTCWKTKDICVWTAMSATEDGLFCAIEMDILLLLLLLLLLFLSIFWPTSTKPQSKQNQRPQRGITLRWFIITVIIIIVSINLPHFN